VEVEEPWRLEEVEVDHVVPYSVFMGPELEV
jgi:hypothetical protein